MRFNRTRPEGRIVKILYDYAVGTTFRERVGIADGRINAGSERHF